MVAILDVPAYAKDGIKSEYDAGTYVYDEIFAADYVGVMVGGKMELGYVVRVLPNIENPTWAEKYDIYIYSLKEKREFWITYIVACFSQARVESRIRMLMDIEKKRRLRKAKKMRAVTSLVVSFKTKIQINW